MIWLRMCERCNRPGNKCFCEIRVKTQTFLERFRVEKDLMHPMKDAISLLREWWDLA